MLGVDGLLPSSTVASDGAPLGPLSPRGALPGCCCCGATPCPKPPSLPFISGVAESGVDACTTMLGGSCFFVVFALLGDVLLCSAPEGIAPAVFTGATPFVDASSALCPDTPVARVGRAVTRGSFEPVSAVAVADVVGWSCGAVVAERARWMAAAEGTVVCTPDRPGGFLVGLGSALFLPFCTAPAALLVVAVVFAVAGVDVAA